MAFDATRFAQEFGAQVRAVRKYEKNHPNGVGVDGRAQR